MAVIRLLLKIIYNINTRSSSSGGDGLSINHRKGLNKEGRKRGLTHVPLLVGYFTNTEEIQRRTTMFHSTQKYSSSLLVNNNGDLMLPLLLLLLRIAVIQIAVPVELSDDTIPHAQIPQVRVSHFKVCIFGLKLLESAIRHCMGRKKEQTFSLGEDIFLSRRLFSFFSSKDVLKTI